MDQSLGDCFIDSCLAKVFSSFFLCLQDVFGLTQFLCCSRGNPFNLCAQVCVVRIGLQANDFLIHSGDPLLLFREIAAGTQQVVDGRHEEIPLVFSQQIAGEGGQVAKLSAHCFHNKHTEHFPSLQFLCPCRLLA